MTEIFDNITSPSWWFSVVIAGILVSLAAAYIQKGLDRPLSKLSSVWRKWSDEVKANEAATLQRLKQDAQERYFYGMNVLRYHLMALEYGIGATFLALLIDIYYPIITAEVAQMSLGGFESVLSKLGLLYLLGLTLLAVLAGQVAFRYYLFARRANRLLFRARYPDDEGAKSA